MCALLLALCNPAQAQQPTKIPQDWLPKWWSSFPLSRPASRHSARVCASLTTWRGKTSVIELAICRGKMRSASQRSRPRLVRLKVDVIVTSGGNHNPRRQGSNFYDSHCHDERSRSCWRRFRRQPGAPGGNITGLSTFAPELSGKRLEILREVVPKLSRVAVLGSSTAPGYAPTLREIEPAAKAFRVKLQYLDVQIPRILRLHFEPQARGGLTQSSR